MKRLFERCPNCKTDLGNALARHFHGSGDYQTYFEYECGGCGAVLEIEVEAIPQFYCTLKGGLTPGCSGGDLDDGDAEQLNLLAAPLNPVSRRIGGYMKPTHIYKGKPVELLNLSYIIKGKQFCTILMQNKNGKYQRQTVQAIRITPITTEAHDETEN